MPHRKTEFELIDWIRSRQHRSVRTRIGIGDDCAALDLRPDETCLVTTDALVDRVHFDLRQTKAELVGRKAVTVSLSDVAAMGGRPIGVVIATALPSDLAPTDTDKLCRGIFETCDAYAVPLIGGDVVSTPGPLTITSTVLGAVAKRGAIKRSGAKVGDAILVTGELGGSLLGRHLTFEPRLAESQRLVKRFKIHSMIDISDGLSRDLGHILDESGGLGAELDATTIPCSDAARTISQQSGKPPLWHALNDGEDFELLFTASRREAARIAKRWRHATRITLIGRVADKPGIWMRNADARRTRVEIEGYEHLKP